MTPEAAPWAAPGATPGEAPGAASGWIRGGSRRSRISRWKTWAQNNRGHANVDFPPKAVSPPSPPPDRYVGRVPPPAVTPPARCSISQRPGFAAGWRTAFNDSANHVAGVLSTAHSGHGRLAGDPRSAPTLVTSPPNRACRALSAHCVGAATTLGRCEGAPPPRRPQPHYR